MEQSKSLVCLAAVMLCAVVGVAQDARDSCGPATVIPLSGEEPAAKLLVDPPLAGPVSSRGVAVIAYCAQNLRLMPVFGPSALAVSPRIGHVHVRVDDASYVWADASGNPIILMGLSPGPHKVLIELMDTNHHKLDEGAVRFVDPENSPAKDHH
jgi:hypothetical protein